MLLWLAKGASKGCPHGSSIGVGSCWRWIKVIRYAAVVDNSVVDGTGIRITVFLQGCVRGCEGCHNPDLQPLEGGEVVSEEALAQLVLNKLSPLHRGVTFSGGEPLLQAQALEKVISILKREKPDIDVWMYTGFTFEEIQEIPVLRMIDVVVDGPFVLAQRDLSLAFRGSRNQRIIDVPASLAKSEVVELKLD
ncbi:MAG TPA: anaerobic ribonucleoside-triphosphate reductase activating protein [Syntrophothermus lipocalidus]|nr:anaerobic ribonucleoside-triphosphate reductase activating protein [Syntrophothermus lipocalidus]